MDTSESEEYSEDGDIREEFPRRDTKTPSRIIQKNHPGELIIGGMNVIHKFGHCDCDDVMMMENQALYQEHFPEKSYSCPLPQITF
jgi:hypothetical protein